MTYSITIYDGFTPAVGDDMGGGVSNIRDPKTGDAYFDSLRKAKSVARQASKFVAACVGVVDDDTDTIAYVASDGRDA